MQDLEGQIAQIFTNPALIIPLFIWITFWKGFALWRAAGKRQLVWFIILLLINTLGILEIAYIYYLNKRDLGSEKLLAFLEKKLGKKANKQ